MDLPLTPTDRETLLSAARLALQTSVKTGRMPDLILSRPGVTQIAGAFVNLRVSGLSRSCVGDLTPETPLYQTVMNLATMAASEGVAAYPIEAEELHEVRIEIGVVRDLCPLLDVREIATGGIGLALVTSPPTILLPDFIEAQGLSPVDALKELLAQAEKKPGATESDLRSIQRFELDRFSEGASGSPGAM